MSSPIVTTIFVGRRAYFTCSQNLVVLRRFTITGMEFRNCTYIIFWWNIKLFTKTLTATTYQSKYTFFYFLKEKFVKGCIYRQCQDWYNYIGKNTSCCPFELGWGQSIFIYGCTYIQCRKRCQQCKSKGCT